MSDAEFSRRIHKRSMALADSDRGSGWEATRKSFAIVLLAFFVIMIDGFDLQALGFVAPELLRDWHLSLAQFGPVFSAALLGSVLGALGAGLAAEIIGLRRALVAALLVFGLSTLALVRVHNGELGWLAIMRLLAGVGLGAATPLALSVVAANSPRPLQARLPTIALCGQPLGSIGGAAICAYFIPSVGWVFAFYLGGLLPLLVALAVPWVIPATAPSTSARAGRAGPRADMESSEVGASVSGAPGLQADSVSAPGFLELFHRRWLATTLAVAVCVVLANMLIYFVLNYLPALVREQGYSLQDSVSAVSMFNAGGIVGSLLLAGLVDRYGWIRVLPSMLVLAALAVALVDVSRSSYFTLLAISLLAGLAGYGGAVTLGPLALALFPPALRTKGTGCVLGLGRLGGVSGPILVSFALNAGMPLGRLFYVAAVAPLLMSASLLLLLRAHRPRVRVPTR